MTNARHPEPRRVYTPRMRFVVALLVVAGCKSDAPSCAQVTDHLLVVTKQQVVGHDTEELANRDVMIAQCEARELSADTRRCLLAARTLTEIAACKAGDATATPIDPKSVEKPRKPRPPRTRE